MFNDLTPQMQERLEKWKQSILTEKRTNMLKRKSPGNYVPRKGDYGDEFDEDKLNNNQGTK